MKVQNMLIATLSFLVGVFLMVEAGPTVLQMAKDAILYAETDSTPLDGTPQVLHGIDANMGFEIGPGCPNVVDTIDIYMTGQVNYVWFDTARSYWSTEYELLEHWIRPLGSNEVLIYTDDKYYVDRTGNRHEDSIRLVNLWNRFEREQGQAR